MPKGAEEDEKWRLPLDMAQPGDPWVRQPKVMACPIDFPASGRPWQGKSKGARHDLREQVLGNGAVARVSLNREPVAAVSPIPGGAGVPFGGG